MSRLEPMVLDKVLILTYDLINNLMPTRQFLT